MASPIRYKIGEVRLSKYSQGKWNLKQTNNAMITTRQGNLGLVLTINEKDNFHRQYAEGSLRKSFSKAVNLPITITRSENWNSWSNHYYKYHFGAIFSPEMIDEIDERIKNGLEFKFRQYKYMSDTFVKWKIEFVPKTDIKSIMSKAVIARL